MKATTSIVLGVAMIVAMCFGAACASHVCLGGTDSFGCDVPDGGGSSSDAPVFPDVSGGEPFNVEPSSPQVINVDCNQQTPTVLYAATAKGSNSPIAVSWRVDRGEIGTMVTPGPIDQSTFVPTGTVGSVVNVIATYNNASVERQVFVKLTCSQSPSCPTSQLATSPADLLSGGGIGGVGGEGCGGIVTDTATSNALNAPSSDASLKLIYPYDKTVWPRGQLAPNLMWDWSTGDADAIKIDLKTSSESFKWSGMFMAPAILKQETAPFTGKFIRHPIPQDIWDIATNTAGTLIQGQRDRLTMTLTIAKNGKGYGPITQTWEIAPGRLHGTVYYQSYNTQIFKQSCGSAGCAATLGIKPGATAPTLVLGSPNKCYACHTVAANGGSLVSQVATPDYGCTGSGGCYDPSVDYDLGSQTLQTLSTSTTTAPYAFGALSPDGKLLLSNTIPDHVDAPTLSSLYSLPSGSAVTATGLANVGAGTPVFSPDGKHVAFNNWNGSNADQRSLMAMDFDDKANPPAFSSLTKLHTPTDPSAATYWPTFMPTNDAVVFQMQEDHPQAGYEAQSTQGVKASLWWVDLATKKAAPLDMLNGAGYLPTNASNTHGSDAHMNFVPSVSAISSGGYAWVVFMSRRMYGSVATLDPSCSDSRICNGMLASPTPLKLWVAAIDLNAAPGTDPSHPAFYLPAQELMSVGEKGIWVLDPCKGDGNSCESGDECCNGYCDPGNDGGALVCGSNPNGCATAGDKCSNDADAGVACWRGPLVHRRVLRHSHSAQLTLHAQRELASMRALSVVRRSRLRNARERVGARRTRAPRRLALALDRRMHRRGRARVHGGEDARTRRVPLALTRRGDGLRDDRKKREWRISRRGSHGLARDGRHDRRARDSRRTPTAAIGSMTPPPSSSR